MRQRVHLKIELTFLSWRRHSNWLARRAWSCCDHLVIEIGLNLARKLPPNGHFLLSRTAWEASRKIMIYSSSWSGLVSSSRVCSALLCSHLISASLREVARKPITTKASNGHGFSPSSHSLLSKPSSVALYFQSRLIFHLTSIRLTLLAFITIGLDLVWSLVSSI